MGCLHSLRTDNALKKHERQSNNSDYCHIEMSTKDNNKLKYNHGEKSLKVSFTIYADLEFLLIKQNPCQNNFNESCTERKTMHEPSGYALSLINSFDSKENKYNFHRGEDYMEKFVNIWERKQWE